MVRKKYSKWLKTQIALDAIKGQKTIAELASEYGVHAYQISIWKKQLLDAAPAAFSNGKEKMLRKKRFSEIICIKGLLNYKSMLIGQKKTGYIGWFIKKPSHYMFLLVKYHFYLTLQSDHNALKLSACGQ